MNPEALVEAAGPGAQPSGSAAAHPTLPERVVGVAHVPRSEYPCTAGHGGRLRRACGRQALSLPTPRPNAADSAGHKSCVAEAMPCRYEATMQTALQKFIIAEFIFFDDM